MGRKIFDAFRGRETTFQYDNLGRLNLICKENSENTLYINYERDLLDRIRKETKTGKTGKVLYEIAYTYDKDGNRESIIRNINDKQPIETFSFDSFGREIEHKDGKSNFTKTQYIENFINPINQKVLQIKKTDPKNIKTVLTYDVFSNPTNKNILDAHEAILSSVDSRYDANRNLIETQDHIYEQNNHKKTITTRYTYTENNLVETLIKAYGSEDEKKTVYDYTPSGRLKLKNLPIGTQLQYSYDPLGNLNKINSNDKKVNQTFKYNKLGFLLKAEDKIQQTKIERKIDSFGNILKETFNDNLVIDKQYDNFNRPIFVKLHNAGEVRYRYDPLNIREVIRSSDNKVQYQHSFDEYDLNGNLQKENHIYDLASTRYERDSNGRIIQINNPYFFQTCEYDESGNLIKSIIDNDEHNYSYDELEQLTKEKSDRYESESGYDSNYNRIINNQDEAIINDLDELIQIGDIKLSYDKNGNVTCKETTESSIDFTFDPLNRLLDAKTEKASIQFSYDAIGRRLSKSVNKEGWFSSSYSENYLYDNKQEIGAFDTTGYSKNLKILSYYPNNSFSKAITIEIAGTSYLPIFDIQGNIIKLINSWGSVKQKYDYSSFGEKLNEESLENPWQYQAKRFDSEIDLIYFGKRYYDPQIARWTSVDPAGFVDGLNLYHYLKNNPFKYFDPEGDFAIVLIPVAKVVVDIIALAVIAVTVKWAGDTIVYKMNESQTQTVPKAEGERKFPDRSLPKDKHGRPIPEADAPHTELGTRKGKKGPYPQAREFDEKGKPVRDIDFTDHGRPYNHPIPHQHEWKPNPTGGTPSRSKEPKPL